jgi:alkylation response protein AidB-like acyl-CoA dehydrogenase
MSTIYHAPLADIEFLLMEVLQIGALQSLPQFAHMDADVVRTVLTQGARFAEQVLSPINGPGDIEAAQLVNGQVQYPQGFAEAYARYAADGWLGLDMPERVGGQFLPRVLQVAFAEMSNGANLAFSMLPVTIRAAARLLLAHGDADTVARYVPGMVDGSCAATIVISEPQAGSDVGRTLSLATPQLDGSYCVTGNKVFISNGDHEFAPQIVHMMLARTPGAPAGTRGVSLFLVPKFCGEGAARRRNAVQVMRVEHKMGLKASPTCALEFKDAEAIRIGQEGRGLQTMFAMVNTMRLEVAVQGVGIAAAATSRAIRYAAERLQGGAPEGKPAAIIGHPDIRRMLLTMRARTGALRALTYEAALQLDLGESGDAQALALSQWLLPICKAYATDIALDVANLGVQVFGGYGYVTDGGMEQYVRDVRVAAIYEGTNGIQAIDLVTRKLLGDEGARLQHYVARMRADIELHREQASVTAICAATESGAVLLESVSRQMIEQGRAYKQSPDLEAGAAAYLKLAGVVGGAWMWLRIAGRSNGASALHRLNRSTAEFYAKVLSAEAKLYAEQCLTGAAATALDEEQWMAGQ